MLTHNYYKRLLAQYIAYQIVLDHIYYGNEKADCYNQIYHSSWDIIEYTELEKEEIYQMVDEIVEKDYDYIFAHNYKTEPIYLVKVSNRENSNVNSKKD